MSDPSYVSTGALPSREQVAAVLDEAHRRFAPVADGSCSDVYPALAAADPAHFGICVAGSDGRVRSVGDADVRFTVMSVAKPFVFALVCDAIGHEEARRRLGVNATGLSFNSIEAIERMPGGRTNPMVNAGAIATTGLVPGASFDDRWAYLLDGMSRFAGRQLELDEETLASALATNHRNRALAQLLHASGLLEADPDQTVELYTRQSCVAVDVRDLALLGATLANGGRQPATGDQVVAPFVCHDVLAVMATAGLYETSGDWLWDVGLPGKSGISGAVVAVSPGKGALGVFSPPLDHAGNSVRGQLTAAFVSSRLGLDLFASNPR